MTSHEHSSRKLTNSDNDKRRQAIDELEQKQVELMKEIIQLKKTEARLEEVCQNMTHSSSCRHRPIISRSQSESFGVLKPARPGNIYDRFQTSYTSADWRGTTSGLKFSSVEEKTSGVKPSSVVDIMSGDKSSSAVGMTTGRIINPQSNSWRGFEFIPVEQALSQPQQTSLSANAKGKQKFVRTNSEKIMRRFQFDDDDTIETDGEFPQNKFIRKMLSTETIKNKLKHGDPIFATNKPINQPHLDKGLNIQPNLNTGSNIKSYINIGLNSQSNLMGGARTELQQGEDPVATSRKMKKQEQINSYASFAQQDDPTTWQPTPKVFISTHSAPVTGIFRKEKVVPESLKTTAGVSKPKARLPLIEDVLQVIEQESRDGSSSRLQSELDEKEKMKHINMIKAGLMGSDGRVGHSMEERKFGYPGGGKEQPKAGLIIDSDGRVGHSREERKFGYPGGGKEQLKAGLAIGSLGRVGYSREERKFGYPGGGKEQLKAGVLDKVGVYVAEKPEPMEMNFECEVIDPSLFPLDTPVMVSSVNTPDEASPVYTPVEVSHVNTPVKVSHVNTPVKVSPVDTPVHSSVESSQVVSPVLEPPFKSTSELSVTRSLTITAKPTDTNMESSCHESQTINETAVNDHALKDIKTYTIKSSENYEKGLCTRKDSATSGDNEEYYFGIRQKQNPDSLARKPDLKSPTVAPMVGKNLIISRDEHKNNRSTKAVCSSSCVPDDDEKYSGMCSQDNGGKSNGSGMCSPNDDEKPNSSGMCSQDNHGKSNRSGMCSHHNSGEPDGSGMCPFDLTCMKKQINDVSSDQL
ncbi:uncharacterized protein LOC131947553 [Physella acuta]|uniref:uncharacterized protein LOC131947553 n=1 Tax=Physella acuta TaxID=109671 RepID=UPI0027DE8493|nr:uncharacterized protein LOC131947553 [Physella acuta]